MRWGRRGHGVRLDVLVAAILILIFVGVALPRLGALLDEAERSYLQRTLAELEVALTLETARLLRDGGWSAVAALDGSNPAQAWERQFGKPMPRYGDERGVRGRWSFDAGKLVYVPQRGRLDYGGLAEAGELAFVVSAPGRERGGSRGLDRARLVLLDPSQD